MSDRDFAAEIANARQALANVPADAARPLRARAQLALSRLLFEKAGETADRDALVEAMTVARDGLDALGSRSPYLHALLSDVYGTASCRLYDVKGEPALLDDGLTALRSAMACLREGGSPGERRLVESHLATALVRAGEQRGDIDMLREGVQVLDALLSDALLSDPGAPAAGEPPWILLNAKAVAQLRIGTHTGDGVLIERAADLLRAVLADPAVPPVDQQQTMQNLCAALLENARQLRSERVYQELLSVIGTRDEQAIANDVDAYFVHYAAQASAELFALNGDPELAIRAIAMLEGLVSWHAGSPGPLLTSLHSLAQAHFRLGKHRDPERHFDAALTSLRAAMALASDRYETTDGRWQRLMADLGAYTFALGTTLRRPALLDEAVTYYQKALSLVVAAKAPALFAAMAQGLFYLQFARRDWSAALDAFTDVERAWGFVTADPQLSAETHRQRAREIAGQYPRATWCHLRRGEIEQAALTLDRGRARVLLVNVSRRDGHVAALPDAAQRELAAASHAVERARREDTDKACVAAWNAYTAVRRRHGLDPEPPGLDAAALWAAVPRHGAIVQLAILREGAVALVAVAGEAALRLVPLPLDGIAGLMQSLRGDAASGTPGWQEESQRFIGAGGDSHEPGSAPMRTTPRYARWAGVTTRTLERLGSAIFDRVHAALLDAGLAAGAPIVISPPGELAILPVASAQLRDGTPFSERWSVSLTPSVQLLALGGAAAARVTPHRLLAISAPQAATPTAALPYAAIETAAVIARFPEPARTQLSGDAATVERVVASMREASIIHVSCHSVYDRREPGASGIELADERRLTVTNLGTAVTPAHTRLVFLSSCESGITGQTWAPDEFVGLPSSFLQAGAQAVIGTLWPVYDDAAMVLSDRFYRLFLDADGREALPPASALSLAQRWMRNATVEALCDGGYLSRRDAARLPIARGLRGLSHGSPAAAADENENAGPTAPPPEWPLSEEQLRSKPFAVASEWAAFVLVGR